MYYGPKKITKKIYDYECNICIYFPYNLDSYRINFKWKRQILYQVYIVFSIQFFIYDMLFGMVRPIAQKFLIQFLSYEGIYSLIKQI